MKIKNMLAAGNSPLLSLEVFPPKSSYPLESIFRTLDGLRELSPAFISVTYGTGNVSRKRTVEIASRIKKEYGIVPLAHLTCLGQNRGEIAETLDLLAENNIMNILALRGDLPDEADLNRMESDYIHASSLIKDIRKRKKFGIAAAAYPEGHSESPRLRDSLLHLRKKVEAGAEVLITQLFFDNGIFYDFVERAEKLGINVPLVPGIMPVLNTRQIKRIINLCGVSIPDRVGALLNTGNPADMEKAGIDYAVEQISDLLESGVPGIHIYTMNRVRQIREIAFKTGLIVKPGEGECCRG